MVQRQPDESSRPDQELELRFQVRRAEQIHLGPKNHPHKRKPERQSQPEQQLRQQRPIIRLLDASRPGRRVQVLVQQKPSRAHHKQANRHVQQSRSGFAVSFACGRVEL